MNRLTPKLFHKLFPMFAMALFILLTFGACASLPSVEIEYEGVKYKRTGEQNIGKLEIKTPDGLEVTLDEMANTEAEKYNEAMFNFLSTLSPILKTILPGE